LAKLTTEAQDIIVLDVATVLAEVDGDSVGPCGQAYTGERDGIGL
jgi:hypothetical protein